MDRRIVTWLAAAALVYHTVVGCCAHHGSPCTSPFAWSSLGPSAARHDSCASCGCQHFPGHGNPADSPTESPVQDAPRHDRCNLGSCSFFVSATQSAPRLDVDCVAWLAAKEEAANLLIARANRALEGFSISPPLRTHLLLHVLLI